MNTTRLKKFATEARNKLRQGVLNKLVTLGFDAKGQVAESPVEVAGGAMWKDKPCTIQFYRSFKDLESRITKHGLASVVEEAAYTWFNRFMAIRIMAMNQLCDPVLRFVGSARTPMIVDEARQGHYPEMDADTLHQLQTLLDDDTKTTEQFAILIIAFCHNTPIIEACFGEANSFTELLIPSNILAEDGFIDMINQPDFIEDENYKSSELLGWLYQFYISERKDEVFAKKGKYNADDIPAATQIFTPNWIVKYMVQNAIGGVIGGKDELPEDQRKYYIDAPDGQEPTRIVSDIEELRAGDLGCGSGHILGEMFDLLYEIYIGDGYSRREAVECIFRKNVVGIDIDNRACQLARFALLLRACQKDNSLVDASILPRIIEAPYPFREVYPHDLRGYLPHFFLGTPSESLFDELTECFKFIDDAKELGSIIKFNLGEQNRKILADQVAKWESQEEIPQGIKIALPYMDFILALTDKYDALVMNPPYMGSGSFSDVLANYTKQNYPDAKADLMTVFMEVCIKLCVPNGMWAMINLPSWMFISSFEGLRKNLLSTQHICSLLHLGRGIFGSDFGSVAFVIRNGESYGKGVYRRLFKEHVQVRSVEKIHQLFLDPDYGYYNAEQESFMKIPGIPVGYWISQNLIKSFENPSIVEFGISDGQNITGDNARYMRLFWEIDSKSFGRDNKWVPMAKGGDFRKWYGNVIDVVNWSNEAREEYRRNPAARIQSEYLWYRKGITWNLVSSLGTGFRLLTDNVLFNKAAPTIIMKKDKLSDLQYLLGFLNTTITKNILSLLNPTINTNIAEVFSLPIIYEDSLAINIKNIVNLNLSISKEDWDAHETSWDFQVNELIRLRNFGAGISNGAVIGKDGDTLVIEREFPRYMANYNLRSILDAYKDYWEDKFNTLHDNEEELNKRFIEIYGLQDELTPDVPLDEITILQQGEIKISDEASLELEQGGYLLTEDGKRLTIGVKPHIEWNDDVIIKQLLSYFVGCMMGRYRLDRPGLTIAHPNETSDEVAEYVIPNACQLAPNVPETFWIDSDGIIPLMSEDCGFHDNAASRVATIVRQMFGVNYQSDNLNFIESCLGKSIEQYFIKDFWKDHKKMYQNRPIYWLFASKKGSFQVLVYVHRMNVATVERIRSRYLLPYIERLNKRIEDLEAREALLSTKERKLLQDLRKQVEECTEYHNRLAVIAERGIVPDLDAGIIANHALYGDVVAKLK